MQLKLTFECFQNQKTAAGNYRSPAGNFKITLSSTSNKFNLAMWLSKQHEKQKTTTWKRKISLKYLYFIENLNYFPLNQFHYHFFSISFIIVFLSFFFIFFFFFFWWRERGSASGQCQVLKQKHVRIWNYQVSGKVYNCCWIIPHYENYFQPKCEMRGS